jgi:hypothetical protein
MNLGRFVKHFGFSAIGALLFLSPSSRAVAQDQHRTAECV